VCIRLTEAELRKAVHDLWSRKGFCQEEHFGMFPLDLADNPLPERKRFGMWIVDAKDCHARSSPVQKYAFELLPHPGPIVTFKIERIDVLILFRRVFGVLNGSVGPLLEP